MKLFLFDVDLTLVSTGGAGIRALTRAFDEVLGFPDALAGVAPHGKTDPAIVREICRNVGFPEDEAYASAVEQVLDRYVHHLRREVAESSGYRVLPGILEILEDLDVLPDVAVGLATGNIEAGARIKLERGGLNRYFPFGGFGSDSEYRTEVVRLAAARGAAWKGEPLNPEQTFVIGDTPLDIAAANQAGFRTVGVATGRYPVEILMETGADLVIPDFSSGRDQFLRSTRIV